MYLVSRVGAGQRIHIGDCWAEERLGVSVLLLPLAFYSCEQMFSAGPPVLPPLAPTHRCGFPFPCCMLLTTCPRLWGLSLLRYICDSASFCLFAQFEKSGRSRGMPEARTLVKLLTGVYCFIHPLFLLLLAITRTHPYHTELLSLQPCHF